MGTLNMADYNRISIAGQWYGYFSYGPEYGPELEGEKVIFSFLIEEVFNNQFKGKCIELEGMGASTEVSKIEGFLENEFISFRKEYLTNYLIDEFGNELKDEKSSLTRLSYTGHFDENTKTFAGSWEIWTNEVSFGEGAFVIIQTGNWEISKDHIKYGL